MGDGVENINNDYVTKGREVIKLINKNGCEAYFTGQFARNVLLGKPFDIIEMFTTATNQMLVDIFSNYTVQVIDEQTVNVTYMGYLFSLCTYKLSVQKESLKLTKRHYSSALMHYIERRDFVVNSLAINYSNKVIDIFDAQKDLKRKVIRMIGEPKVRFNESPIRILKALALVSEYGFRLDHKIYKGIKKRKKLLTKLSPALIALELKPIIEGPFNKRAIRIMYDTGIYKKLGIYKPEIKRLYNKYKPETMDEFIINVLVKNEEINQQVLRGATDANFVMKVANLAIANPKSEFDVLTLYRNGLEACLASNKANVCLRKGKKKYKEIQANYEELPIKKTCDLQFKGQDILKITKDNGGLYLIELVEEIEAKVLFGELENDYETIRVYVYKRLYEMRNTSEVQVRVEEEDIQTKQENSNEVYKEPVSNENPFQDNYYEEQKEENIVQEEITEEIIEERPEEDFYDEQLKDIQVSPTNDIDNDIDSEIKKIELDELEDMLNKEIDELIKKSQVLDGLTGVEAVETYNRMKSKYREILIDRYPKYNKLKDRYYE